MNIIKNRDSKIWKINNPYPKGIIAYANVNIGKFMQKIPSK